MKLFSTILVLASSLAASSAFAANPCTSNQLKQLTCVIVDQANGTSARVLVDRSITTGGSRPYCTTGVTQESVLAYAFFKADAPGQRSDLLAPTSKLALPLQALENGQSISGSFDTISLNLENIQAPFKLTSVGGVVQAELNLEAQIISIYSASQATVKISGSGVCSDL